VQIVIVGTRGEGGTDALLRAVWRAPAPARVLMVVPPDARLPPPHPAQGKGRVGEKATAYVCIGATCSLPLTESADLLNRLQS
jgi:uncharacterized protein YyaL (SSP411 family)